MTEAEFHEGMDQLGRVLYRGRMDHPTKRNAQDPEWLALKRIYWKLLRGIPAREFGRAIGEVLRSDVQQLPTPGRLYSIATSDRDASTPRCSRCKTARASFRSLCADCAIDAPDSGVKAERPEAPQSKLPPQEPGEHPLAYLRRVTGKEV